MSATLGGAVWVAFGYPGKGAGLRLLRDGKFTTPSISGIDVESLENSGFLMDKSGALWCGTLFSGLVRIYHGHAERYTSANGLSGDSIRAITEDREGNIWIATTLGIDRFRDVSFKPVYGGKINPGELVGAVLPLHDGTVLFNGRDNLFAIKDGRFYAITNAPAGMPAGMFEDREKRLWIGFDDRLYLYSQKHFTQILSDDSEAIGEIKSFAESKDGSIWAIGFTQRSRKLYRISTQTHRATLISTPTEPTALASDPISGVWIGTGNGDVIHYDNGALDSLVHPAFGFSWVSDIAVASDGAVFVATSKGLKILQKGIYHSVLAPQQAGCSAIYSLILSPEDDLWASSPCGVAKYSLSALKAAKSLRDSIRTETEFFDLYDGARPSTPGSFPSMAFDSAGRLWLASTGGLSVLDSAHLHRNLSPPPVHIEAMLVDGQSRNFRLPIRIAPPTNNIEFNYAGLSLSIPEKMRFRYQLRGFDSAWHEAGGNRQALYTNLPPGAYRFQVIACNNDGVWNEVGDSVDFVLLPKWYQRKWIRILLTLTTILLLWMLYRLRIHFVTAAITARFDERIDERMRLARELHDTFLQTVQGSKMVADDALAEDSDEPRMQSALLKISGWLGQAVTEGRDALRALRTTTEDRDFAESLVSAAAEISLSNSGMSMEVTINGVPRTLHPIVREELWQIGFEAIRNAAQHSGADLLQFDLSYSSDFIILVKDNGIGIEPEVVASGKEGHFGLQGMRERALRIGGKFSVTCAAEKGTEILVSVPGSVAYCAQTKLESRL
jgi:ligand-binding sensor domain-containing protein